MLVDKPGATCDENVDILAIHSTTDSGPRQNMLDRAYWGMTMLLLDERRLPPLTMPPLTKVTLLGCE